MILRFLVYVVVHNTKKRKNVFCNCVGGPRGYFVLNNLSEIIRTKTDTLLITYLWNLTNKKNEYDKTNGYKIETSGYQRGEGRDKIEIRD